MKLLLVGDVVGRSGREAVAAHLPGLRRDLGLDFVVVNGENAAHGFGLTGEMCEAFIEAGADLVTTGNHVWDQREIIAYIETQPRLLRPANYPAGTPGRGVATLRTTEGRTVMAIHVMTRLFMDPLDDPFGCLEAILDKVRLGATVDAIIVDVHGEATSEKMALGHALDGRVSMVVGTHTHVPTADAQRLPGGTGYQSDAGMTGDYDSVIGMKKEISIARFRRKMPGQRMEPADGEATLCAVLVETDDKTGLALSIAPIRIGGRLAATPVP